MAKSNQGTQSRGPAQSPQSQPDAAPESTSGIRTVKGTIEFLKKIAPRLVMEAEISPPEGEAVDLYTVLGVATGTKSGETTYGPWVAVTGNFEAIRAKDGKRFASGTAFLPEPFNGMLAAAVIAALQPDEETGEVQNPAIRFAVVVTQKKAKNAVGYEYVAKPLVEVSQADPLADLRTATAGLLPAPALPAPST